MYSDIPLGPLLFNKHIHHIFFQNDDSDIPSYGGDNTPYACCESIDKIIQNLQDIHCIKNEVFEILLKDLKKIK